MTDNKEWQKAIKDKAIKDFALRTLTEEFPEKFGEVINWSGVIKGETIILTGNFEIFETEVHKKPIEYNEEKKTYTIILKRK